MTMATIASALNTTFTPAAGDFIVQTTGPAILERRNTSGAAWVIVANLERGGYIIANPVAAAQYQISKAGETTPTIQADQ
jgi:hypothetical protein